MKKTFLGLIVAAIAFHLMPAAPARSQITPDRTLPVNTVVNTNGTTHTIIGGTQVGGNQFHSFDRFSVPTNNTAYFNNSPETANIISRVTGTSISNIDGLIKANGQANLFLVNPNGIIFGQNARLDIGGSFTATTTNSIKFADGTEFGTTNPSATPLLTMSAPLGLQYGKSNPGATISSQGNLSAGQDLTLVADKLDLQGQLKAGRDLTLQAQDSVKIRDTATTPFVANSGRDMTIRGDRDLDILALNHPLTNIQSVGNLSLVSNGDISGDAHFFSGGNMSVLATDGKLGSLISKYDPLIYANGNVSFGNYTGIALKVEATGSIQAGNITITGAECLAGSPGCVGGIPNTDPDFAVLTGGRALILRSGLSSVNTPNLPRNAGGTNFIAAPAIPLGISVGNITTANTGGIGGDVILSAANGNITTGAINSRGAGNQRGGAVSINSAGNIRINGDLTTSQSFTGGSTTLLANGNVDFGLYNGGTLRIFAGGSVTATNSINFTTNTADTFNYRNVALWNGTRLDLSGITLSNGSNPNLSGTPDPVLLDIRAGMIFPGSGITATNANITLANVFTRQGSRGLVLLTNQYNPNSLSGNIQFDNLNIPVVNLNKGIDAIADSRGNITTKDIRASSTVGNGGSATLLAKGDITVNGNIITTSTSGNGGGINLLANGNIQFGNNSLISSNTALNARQSGRIDLNSKGTISGNGISIQSTSRNPNLAGKNGDITITAGSLYLTNGSQVTSSIEGGGTAGDINLAIAGDAIFDRSIVSSSIETNANGIAGNLKINARSLQLLNGSQLLAAVFGQGTGGKISIRADAIALDGSGFISGRNVPTTISTSVEKGAIGGTSGAIDIRVNTISLTNGATIASTADARGSSGNIAIAANSLNISGGAQIQTLTNGSGDAGNISLFLRDLLQLSGDNSAIRASALANSTGKTGKIFIDPLVVNINDGARITVSSLGTGDGGSIDLRAGSLFLDNGIIRAFSQNGVGGNISLTVQDLILLRRGSSISAAAFGINNNANGGNIDINTGFLVAVPYENSDIVAFANGGRGGNINVTTQAVYGIEFRPFLTPFSDFNVSSRFNLNGTVTINTPGIDPSKGLGNLPVDVGDASKLVPQRCLADKRDSEFVITGRGGVPANPSELVSGVSLLDNLGSSNNSAAIASNPLDAKKEVPDTPDTIVEAQGWTIGDRGQITLVGRVPATPASAWSSQPKCVPVSSR